MVVVEPTNNKLVAFAEKLVAFERSTSVVAVEMGFRTLVVRSATWLAEAGFDEIATDASTFAGVLDTSDAELLLQAKARP